MLSTCSTSLIWLTERLWCSWPLGRVALAILVPDFQHKSRQPSIQFPLWVPGFSVMHAKTRDPGKTHHMCDVRWKGLAVACTSFKNLAHEILLVLTFLVVLTHMSMSIPGNSVCCASSSYRKVWLVSAPSLISTYILLILSYPVLSTWHKLCEWWSRRKREDVVKFYRENNLY